MRVGSPGARLPPACPLLSRHCPWGSDNSLNDKNVVTAVITASHRVPGPVLSIRSVDTHGLPGVQRHSAGLTASGWGSPSAFCFLSRPPSTFPLRSLGAHPGGLASYIHVSTDCHRLHPHRCLLSPSPGPRFVAIWAQALAGHSSPVREMGQLDPFYGR